MTIKRQYFGTDGVRGVANQHPITPEWVLQLACAAAKVLATDTSKSQRSKCVIGRDTRNSGRMLEMAMAAGLSSVGVDVILLGVLPTPGVACLAKEMGADFGIVISASHNPFYDNGIKFINGDGCKLSDEIEIQIEKTLEDKSWVLASAEQLGNIEDAEHSVELYVNRVLKSVEGLDLTGVKLALDCANGAAIESSRMALQKLGAEVTCMDAAPNGLNINLNSGCTHPEKIVALMKVGGHEVGIAHDGDADRVLMIDEKGELLDGDELLCIAAAAMLKKGCLKNNTLVVTAMSNFGVEEALLPWDGKVVRTAVGDRYVLEAMKKYGYVLGGEQSGHFIFGEWASTGDGLLSALQILKMMKESRQPLSQLRGILKKYPQVLMNMRVKERKPLENLGGVQSKIREAESVLQGQGRVFIRYSGTEPLIRLLIEGRDLDQIKSLGTMILDEVRIALGEW
jgi:phosphoglucosamine mutase